MELCCQPHDGKPLGQVQIILTDLLLIITIFLWENVNTPINKLKTAT